MKMSSKIYDVLKFVAWLWVPLTALITSFLDTWFVGAEWVDPAVKTLLAIEVFIGSLVAKSNIDYNKELKNEQSEKGEQNESVD